MDERLNIAQNEIAKWIIPVIWSMTVFVINA